VRFPAFSRAARCFVGLAGFEPTASATKIVMSLEPGR
jgi:hypothetical protein